MSNYRTSVNMIGDGHEQLTVPSGYLFLTITNNSDNFIYVYNQSITNNFPTAAIVSIPQYQSLTIPIDAKDTQYTIHWVNGGAIQAKPLPIIFSKENLAMNSTLGTAIAGTVTLVADNTGLVKKTDLNIDGSGNQGVTIKGDESGLLKTNDLSIDGSKRLNVNLLSVPNKQTFKAVATAAQSVTVKTSGGNVFTIKVVTPGIEVTLKAGSVERWQGDFNGMFPIQCATNVTLEFSGAGVAYVQYD